MRLGVDTGVFSAALGRRRRPAFKSQVARFTGNQIFLAAVTDAELRYGALVAEWGTRRFHALAGSNQRITGSQFG